MNKKLLALQPRRVERVIDVISHAGVNVGQWSKKAGQKPVGQPTSNPSQVYRWSFLEPGKVAVLFIWFDKIKIDAKGILYSFNSRKQIQIEGEKGSVNRRLRAEEMDNTIQIARRDNLEVRAVIVDRPPKGKTRRHLDNHPWEITSYNFSDGACVLRRRDSIIRVVPPQAPPTRYLVLAENDTNAGDFSWQDVTGERYHFPNRYRNLILPGVRFIYYRGTRSATGERQSASYFGIGTIGDVYPDPQTANLPKARQKWLANIAEYSPFNNLVKLRTARGFYIETGSLKVGKNFWGSGVRTVKADQFQQIAEQGGISAALDKTLIPVGMLEAPSEGLFLLTPAQKDTRGDNRKNFNAQRLSKNSKVIGDAAETLFFEYLLSTEQNEKKRKKIIWHAREGGTPGYDIEDARNPTKVIGYEVKGTTGNSFLSFDFTANEMKAALEMRDRYVIVLVTNCMSERPQFQLLSNPHALFEQQTLEAIPTVFRIEHRA